MSATAWGYDGNGFGVGDRVELHPGLDLWMRGARFGTVTRVRTRSTRVNVRVDRTGRVITADQTRFRRIA
jgi:hypothetical protein